MGNCSGSFPMDLLKESPLKFREKVPFMHSKMMPESLRKTNRSMIWNT